MSTFRSGWLSWRTQCTFLEQRETRQSRRTNHEAFFPDHCSDVPSCVDKSQYVLEPTHQGARRLTDATRVVRDWTEHIDGQSRRFVILLHSEFLSSVQFADTEVPKVSDTLAETCA